MGATILGEKHANDGPTCMGGLPNYTRVRPSFSFFFFIFGFEIFFSLFFHKFLYPLFQIVEFFKIFPKYFSYCSKSQVLLFRKHVAINQNTDKSKFNKIKWRFDAYSDETGVCLLKFNPPWNPIHVFKNLI